MRTDPTTLKAFLAQTDDAALRTVTRAVARQIGGWRALRDGADDIVRGGADAGWHGFIYTCDTCAFTKRNRRALLELLRSDADDLGYETIAAMVADFRCLQQVTTHSIIEGELIGLLPPGDVANALAWWALERVADAICGDQ